MKWVLEFVAYISVLLSIYTKVAWIYISSTYVSHAESSAKFFKMFPTPFIVLIDLLAVFSAVFFILSLTSDKKKAKPLYVICLIIQSLYLFLEVWQFL